MNIIIIIIYYNNVFVFPSADNCQKHTMVCKACNSYVHNTNDMTLLHLNECFNGKFNDDHCNVQNYLYCFSCKTNLCT